MATKTSRIVKAADGKLVSDFGARRAHNMDAAVYGARASYIGGAAGTATVLAGQMFGIPVSGTMAHSWGRYDCHNRLVGIHDCALRKGIDISMKLKVF